MSISKAKNGSQFNWDDNFLISLDIVAIVIKSRQVYKANLPIYPDTINWL